jgi:SnoaL-like protein
MGVIERLRDIEEIRQVKHRYLRCVDLKLWDELGDTLTEYATLDTGTSAFGKLAEITGRTQIIAFFRARLGPAMLTGHTASQPEITVDGDTAAGIWSHHETVLATRHRMVIASTGFCEESYERGADARWRIARISHLRTYEVMASLGDLPSFKIIAALGGEPPESPYGDARPPADMTPARAGGSNGATADSAGFSAGRPPAGSGTGNGQ